VIGLGGRTTLRGGRKQHSSDIQLAQTRSTQFTHGIIRRMNRLNQRDAKILRVILIEGLANLTVLLIKLLVGLATGSLAVLGDAIHSFTDVINNIAAWFVTRHSAKPADPEHPYGHRKFETVAVFILAALLAVFAFELGLHAITGETTEVATGSWELGLMFGVLMVNIFVSIWQRIWAKRLKSDILLADASHTFSDVLITSSVIVGWQLSAMGWVWIDRLCALAVAGLIFYLAFGLFKRTLPVLLDERAIEPDTLRAAIQDVEGVRAVPRVRSRWVGSARAVDLVIEVDAQLPTATAHEITDRLEALLEDRFQAQDVSIHVEPHIEKEPR
jgi:cation diffusion facilitator family transporter